MKTNNILIAATITIIFIFYPDETLARAGGGSSSGGGSGGGILGLILAPFFMIYSGIITYIANKKNKHCKELLKIASRKDGFWDYYSMKARIEETYFKVQEAWMERDQDIAKEYMSKRLYNKHKTQTDDLIKKGHINILENVNLKDAKVVEILDFVDDKRDSFWVLIHGSMTDYTILEKTGNIINGNKKNSTFKELWRFKRENHGWMLDQIDQDVTLSDLNSFNPFV